MDTMMFKRMLFSFVAVLAFAVVPASATTITFSELGLADGDALTNQLLSLGVLFTPVNATADIDDDQVPPAGSTVVGQFVSIGSTSGDGILRVQFFNATDSSIPGYVDGATLFFDLWDTNPATIRTQVNAYDVNNNFLGFMQMGPGEYQNAVNSLSGNIHRLDFVDVGGDGHVMDNLVYGPITDVPIPEPGTFGLLGIGRTGLGLALHRKRA